MNISEASKQTDVLMKQIFQFTNASAIKSRSGPVLILQGGAACDVVPAVCRSVCKSANNVVKLIKIEEAKEYIKKNEVRLFVLDMQKKDFGMDLLESLKEEYPDLPIIVSIADDSFREEIERSFPDIEIIHEGACQCDCQHVLCNLNQQPVPHWTLLKKA